MSASTPSGTAFPADPEHDAAATYAVDQALVRRLAGRVVATSGEWLSTYSPLTGQPLTHLQQSSTDDVTAAVAGARRAQLSWATVPADLRASILLGFHDLVLDRQDEILDVVQLESGKARAHAFEEVAHVALTARYYARMASRLLASRRRPGLFPVLTSVQVRRAPKGVVGVVSPWNYPFTMALADGLAAVVAGNAVVHKPDAQAVLSALLGVDLLTEAGLPAGVWQVVHGDGRVLGPAVVGAADHVCFTGSTVTGRSVAQLAAARLVGASLELGGKNPMLVLRDADVDAAVEGAVRGCFSSAGQICVGIERLYVADQVYDAFVSRLVERAESLVLSAGMDYGADVGSLASSSQLERVERHVEDARTKGATVLAGGRRREDVGRLFYAPTVLSGVRPGMACFAEETFGPVVSVYRFSDEADAVARANAGDYGLNAAIYTRDVARGRRLAARIRCGSVNINDPYAASFGSIAAPMGGMACSGLGRRQGPEGLWRFTDEQSVVTQRLLPLRPVLGMSQAQHAKMMTTALRMMNRLRRR